MAYIKDDIIRREDQPVTLSGEQLDRLSHDFRAPLNIIIGFAELLLDEAPGGLNDEQRCSLNDIMNSGHRLLDLVNEVFNPPPAIPPKVVSRPRLAKTAEIYFQR